MNTSRIWLYSITATLTCLASSFCSLVKNIFRKTFMLPPSDKIIKPILLALVDRDYYHLMDKIYSRLQSFTWWRKQRMLAKHWGF
jgi:hypothetical protein